MKLFGFVLFFLIAGALSAQDHLAEVQSIRTLDEAHNYADKFQEVNVAFMHDRMDNEPYLLRKDSLQPGDTYEASMYRISVVSEGKKKLYRFKLISLTDEQFEGQASELADNLVKELKSGASFDSLFNVYASNVGNPAQSPGDVGWVDLDYFIPSFQKDLKNKHKGDMFASHDATLGWHNVVVMTEEPEKVQGHYVLFFPELSMVNSGVEIDHGIRIDKLKKTDELIAYANKNAEYGVSLILLNNASNPMIFEAIEKAKVETKRRKPILVEDEDIKYRWIKDTTVELFSFQYVFIDGSVYEKEEKNRMLNDIYSRFQSGTPFDDIAKEYWNERYEMSTMQGIEGSLLMSELTAKLKSTETGELFVARTSQSYFIGIPLKKPETVDAHLVIQYY